MVQYNLVTRSIFSTLTSTGEGNKSLTPIELNSLIDNTTTSGGVTLTSGDSLWLRVDLSSRMYLDSMSIYINSGEARATVASATTFFYRNNTTDSFITVDTSDNGTNYYADNLPDAFAPKECLVTISGVACDVIELKVINDDIPVAFGSDGTTTSYVIDDAPIGGESTIHTIPIYNNDTSGLTTTAYVVADYTGAAEDSYIKISSDGDNFYSIYDGVNIDSDNQGEPYNWSLGKHSNTKISGQAITLVTGQTTGTYTTPIFQYNGRYALSEVNLITASGIYVYPSYIKHRHDQYHTSYALVKETSVSGTSITKTDTPEGTIEVRSSDTDPIDVNEVYYVAVHYTSSNYRLVVYKDNLITGEKNINVYSGQDLDTVPKTNSFMYGPFINRRNGYIYAGALIYYTVYNYSKATQVTLKWDGTVLYENTGAIPIQFQHVEYFTFDSGDYLWTYNTTAKTLYLITWDRVLQKSITDNGLDFVNGIAGSYISELCWIVSKAYASVRLYNHDGEIIVTTPIPNAAFITSTLDGGCWVCDDDTWRMHRLAKTGEVLSTWDGITNDLAPMLAIESDLQESDGVWALHGAYVHHYSAEGTADVGNYFPGASDINVSSLGVEVYSFSKRQMWFMNFKGEITHSTVNNLGPFDSLKPRLASSLAIKHYDIVNYNEVKYLPLSSDPVWGDSGSLTWTEIPKNGFYLPKLRYHQFRLTLNRESDAGYPVLEGLYMPMAVAIPDIEPQGHRPLYVKVKFDGISDETFITKIKCWWTK